jgi:F-type H+-transporting ATPase subunit epsilon
MNLEILTPEKKLFSADVYGVQLPGVEGMFEVLDRHAPLVGALREGQVKVLKDKHNQVFFTIQSGFVEVIHNSVTVLVEGAVPVEGKS